MTVQPRTLPELFLQAVERHDRPDLMRYKAGGDWAKIPAREFREEVELAAHGLIALGIQAGDRVALLSENRPGWALADLATLSVGAWVVPIYTSLPPDEVQYILEDSGARACVVSTAPQLAKVLEVRERCRSLSWLISLDPVEREEEWLLTARHLVEKGRQADLVVVDGNPLDDVTVLLDPARIELVLKSGAICADRRKAARG